MRHTAKAMLKRKFTAMQDYIMKEGKAQIDSLKTHIKISGKKNIPRKN